jgi:PST family polysaccharide transporter
MTQEEKFKALTCTEGLRKDLRVSSVRAAAFTWAAGAVDFVLRIVSTAILARLILPEQFGLVMMVTAVTAIADQFRDLGLSSATVQRKEISHQQVSNLFWINVAAGAGITVVFCCLSPLISAYYREPRLTIIACALATNFAWGGLMVQHQALLARQLKLGHSAVVRVASSVASTVLAIILAWVGLDCWALVWREVARNIFLAIGMWICFPWIPSLPSRKADIRALLGFGVHLSAANLVGSVSAGADRFLLGRFWGAAPVALYRQAYQLLVMPIEQLLSPVYQVTQPGLSMLQSDAARFRRYYLKVLVFVCVASMPLSLFVAVYSTEITLGLLGGKWSDSGPILMILAFGSFIRQPVTSAAFVLITRGLSREYLRLSVVHNVTVIAFMAVGSRWGIKGAAVADVAAIGFLIAPRLYCSLKGSPISVRSFFATIARPMVASVLMAVVLLGVRYELSGAPMAVSVGVGLFAAGVAFFGFWMILPGGREELTALSSDVRVALQQKTRSAAVENSSGACRASVSG